ncbi:MAG: PepSY-associated TM helix domain-containing protein [Azoarcus sp.]|nr:PepSY-associated TM helix domain-containing protein [Azoarcus sp.]
MAIRNRKLWFRVHGWLSLPVWLVFCLVCVTGTIAVISHELTWLTNPAARADNPDGLPARPLPELVAAVQQAVPGAQVSRIIVFEPYLVTAVGIAEPGKPPALAYVNPYTAEVQAINRGITFIGFMRALHGWLLFPWHQSWSLGYYLVAAMSVVTLGAMITGIVIYKRFWRAFTRPQLRTGAGARVLLGDLHRLAGAWSLWFLLVLGATGLWYLVQAVLWHNDVHIWDDTPMVEASAVPLTNGTPPAMIGLQQALDEAQRAIPGLAPRWVSFPEHSRAHFDIAGDGGSFLYDQYSWRVQVEPWSGTVAEVRTPAAMTALQTVAHIADPLHYGTLGGIWTKAIWFVFGLLLSAMSITGFLIWSKRTFTQTTRVAPGTRTDDDGRDAGLEGAR